LRNAPLRGQSFIRFALPFAESMSSLSHRQWHRRPSDRRYLPNSAAPVQRLSVNSSRAGELPIRLLVSLNYVQMQSVKASLSFEWICQ